MRRYVQRHDDYVDLNKDKEWTRSPEQLSDSTLQTGPLQVFRYLDDQLRSAKCRHYGMHYRGTEIRPCAKTVEMGSGRTQSRRPIPNA